MLGRWKTSVLDCSQGSRLQSGFAHTVRRAGGRVGLPVSREFDVPLPGCPLMMGSTPLCTVLCQLSHGIGRCGSSSEWLSRFSEGKTNVHGRWVWGHMEHGSLRTLSSRFKRRPFRQVPCAEPAALSMMSHRATQMI